MEWFDDDNEEEKRLCYLPCLTRLMQRPAYASPRLRQSTRRNTYDEKCMELTGLGTVIFGNHSSNPRPLPDLRRHLSRVDLRFPSSMSFISFILSSDLLFSDSHDTLGSGTTIRIEWQRAGAECWHGPDGVRWENEQRYQAKRQYEP